MYQHDVEKVLIANLMEICYDDENEQDYAFSYDISPDFDSDFCVKFADEYNDEDEETHRIVKFFTRVDPGVFPKETEVGFNFAYDGDMFGLCYLENLTRAYLMKKIVALMENTIEAFDSGVGDYNACVNGFFRTVPKREWMHIFELTDGSGHGR